MSFHAHRGGFFPRLTILAAAIAALPVAGFAADEPAPASSASTSAPTNVLPEVKVRASADATAGGLAEPYAGGQVARGGRVGVLGDKDIMDVPFTATNYTNELIADQQSRSVGDVLLNDPSVRVARGFGNFQESYFVRGFLLGSDNVSYNGLYGLLPRQYISADLFERVEVLRGASGFLNGATPGGDGIGGAINLLPKRAPNEALNRFTAGISSGSQGYAAADVARRFGPGDSTGIRINLARRDGGTGVSREKVDLSLLSVGLDWRGQNARLSGDLGYQDHKLKQTRTSVSLGGGVTSVPTAPSADSNWAQPWSYSNEKDTFGTLRGEYDFSSSVTAYAAAGFRQGKEANSLANITLSSATGAANTYRFDNARRDDVSTGEAGLRWKLNTGAFAHQLVASLNGYRQESRNAYAYSTFNGLSTNLYNPFDSAQPALSTFGNDLSSPRLTTLIRLSSFAVGDTLSFLGDRVNLTIGARRQKIDVTSYAYNTGTPSGNTQSRTSPMAGLVVKFGKQFSAYGNYIEGLSPGETAGTTTPTGAVVTNAGASLAPYVSKQKELGLKFDGGRIGGSVAYFNTTKPRGIYDAGNTFVLAGEDEHQGVEMMAYGEPLNGLKVLGGVTFLDAKQRKTGQAGTDGKKVIGVPDAQASVGLDWRVPGVTGLSLDTRMIYSDSVYADAANTLKVSAWTRYDLGARYITEIAARPVTFRLRVENLANRNYWASAGGYPGSGYLVLGAPRTFMLSASVDL